MTEATEIKEQRICHYEGCGKKRFAKGPISSKDCCSGHHKREDRLKKAQEAGIAPQDVPEGVLGKIRHYGEGSHAVTTKVTNEVLGMLQAKADQHYDGSIPPLVREILLLWCEGNLPDPVIDTQEPSQQEGTPSVENQHPSQVT